MFKEAVAEWQKAFTLTNNPELAAMIGQDFEASGYKEVLQDWLAGLEEEAKHEYVSPYEIASGHARVGEKDQVFVWLEKAFQERDSRIVALRVEPVFESLRSDPKFQDLVKRIGFPK
jgi:hypothetical protein